MYELFFITIKKRINIVSFYYLFVLYICAHQISQLKLAIYQKGTIVILIY